MVTAAPTRRWLLHVARRALAEALGVEHVAEAERPDDPALAAPAALFVSWHEGRRLQGCLGTLEPRDALEQAVRTYAVRAGLHDPRMSPATPESLPRLTCEISVLGPRQPLSVTGVEAIASAIVPHRDGLVIRHGERSAVYLPVVWQSLPDPRAFVAALCKKAGIDVVRHGANLTAQTFVAQTFGPDPSG